MFFLFFFQDDDLTLISYLHQSCKYVEKDENNNNIKILISQDKIAKIYNKSVIMLFECPSWEF